MDLWPRFEALENSSDLLKFSFSQHFWVAHHLPKIVSFTCRQQWQSDSGNISLYKLVVFFWTFPELANPPPLIDVRGCRHSGFRHSGFSPRGLDVRGSDVRGRLFWTLGFRTFGVFENGRSGLNPERLKLNAVSLNPERPKTPNVRK